MNLDLYTSEKLIAYIDHLVATLKTMQDDLQENQSIDISDLKDLEEYLHGIYKDMEAYYNDVPR